jgi:hypothetical protein
MERPMFKTIRKSTPAILTAALLMGPAGALAKGLSVKDCDGTADSARNLVEPWDKNTRTFANGTIRVAVMDTGGEPVCCSTWLLVIVPNKNDEQGYPSCKLVGGAKNLGMLGLDLTEASAKYAGGRGLVLRFPYMRYVDGLNDTRHMGVIDINAKNGTVTPR